jgi:hypothetical protein
MPLPDELRDLFLRYTQLGLLIPPLEDLDDPDTRARAELVLLEMVKVDRQIDEFLGRREPIAWTLDHVGAER